VKTSDHINEIAAAIAKYQESAVDSFKGSTGYGYLYASLDAVLKDNRGLLAKNGISHVQSQEFSGDTVTVSTRLMHTSGQWIETTVSGPFARLKGMNDYQSLGSAVTYLRRYGLSAALGVSSDEDKDARGEQQAQIAASEDQVMEIESLMASTGSDRAGLMKFFSVDDIGQLTSESAKKAITMLQKKAKG
jgi:hypothetical protein